MKKAENPQPPENIVFREGPSLVLLFAIIMFLVILLLLYVPAVRADGPVTMYAVPGAWGTNPSTGAVWFRCEDGTYVGPNAACPAATVDDDAFSYRHEGSPLTFGVNAIPGGCLDCEPDSCADWVGTLVANEPAQVSPILAVVREWYDDPEGGFVTCPDVYMFGYPNGQAPCTKPLLFHETVYPFDSKGDLIAWLNCRHLEPSDFIGAWRRGLAVEVLGETKAVERTTTHIEAVQEWRAP